MSSSLLTTEFLLSEKIPQQWFDDVKRVWNECLFNLNWLQHYRRCDRNQALDLPPVEIKVRKVGDDWVGYCDRAQQFRIDKQRSWDSENIEMRPCCTLVNPKWLTPPPISSFSSIEVKKPFAQKRCEWLKQSSTPSVYVNDFIELVIIPAWEAYQKGIREKPKYKRSHQQVNTITSASFRSQCEVLKGDRLKLPGIEVTVPGLRRRLLDPIDRMIVEMRNSPENYPRLTTKIDKLVTKHVNELIKADGQVKKDLSEEELQGYRDRIDKEKIMESAIAYFSKPGSFRIIKREGKVYLQITAEMPVTTTKSDKSVGIDTGLDLLVHSTSGLQVKHQDFTRELARIDNLNTKLSRMKYGSNNYIKLSSKIKEIQGRIKRSKRSRQSYWAQQIADVNQFVSIKEIKPKLAIENPLPVKTKEGKYIKNGKKESRLNNRELHDRAISQFITLVGQACKKKDRTFVKIEIEPEAVPAEVLEVADFPVQANHASSGVVTIANPPKINSKLKRDRKKERQIK